MVGSFKGPPEVHGHGFKVSPVGVGMFFSSQAQLHGSHWDRGEGELDRSPEFVRTGQSPLSKGQHLTACTLISPNKHHRTSAFSAIDRERI